MADRREKLLEEARRKLKAAMLKRDAILLHTVGTINELNRASNLLSGRLQEWYGMYFPELKLADAEKYARFVAMFDRKNLEKNTLSDLVGAEKASEIIRLASSSIGIEPSPAELESVRKLAGEIVALHAVRDSIEELQAGIAKEVAPNLCHLVEPALAAKLIAQAGSIERLASLPASTVQVLGAEKALFKHLRKGTRPPKYGIIFQHPLISNAPPGHAGKLARALATKLVIAAKADAFTKNFIAPRLKENFDKRVREIQALLKKSGRSQPQGRSSRWKR